MKIVHLSTRDIGDGASRAAYRLHRGLCDLDVDSRMWTRFKASDDHKVIASSNRVATAWGQLRGALDRLPFRLCAGQENVTYSIGWVPSFIYRNIRAYASDIVHLHWICDAHLSVESIAKLGGPIVWTLHDMWPFTGGCHYDQDCGRFTQSCGACPQLHSRVDMDLSRWVWWRKRRAWQDLDLTFATPSRWLAACAMQSSLFKNRHVHVIPYGLDIERFRPIDRKTIRRILNLPLESKLVLFSAMRATSDPRKGFDLLVSALHHLRASMGDSRVELVVVGSSELNLSVDLGFQSHCLGYFHDELPLALVYSAADVMVVPSIQEGFGQTALEAIACGTPVVAFGATGPVDIIDHCQNGYLAEPFDLQDLAHGIQWVVEDESRHYELSENARRKAVREFDRKIQAQRYRDLYKDILDRGR